MSKKILGTAITDENGEATFIYKGEGVGKINIIAKAENLESAPCEIDDCLFYDRAIDNNNNNNWKPSKTDFQIFVQETGTLIKYPNRTDGANYYAYSQSKINYFVKNNFCIEFDVIYFEGNPKIRVSDSTRDFTINTKITNQEQTNHIKILFKNTQVQYQINNGEIKTSSIEFDISKKHAISFYMPSGVENSIKFKDFKVYLL